MINQLAELHEIAPDVCQHTQTVHGYYYTIGEYDFWESHTEFVASFNHSVISNQPAFDWLQGALRRAIEKKGMDWELSFYTYWYAKVDGNEAGGTGATAALLSALIAALKADQ